MKLLLTSNGISNASIHQALTGLLGKPISECNALFIPTAIYPFAGGPGMAWRALNGQAGPPLCQLGWKSLGLLELTALPSVLKENWVASVEAADALLVWGGDPLYLSYWLRQTGLTEVLSTLPNTIYVGVSAGSMATSTLFSETYTKPPGATSNPLSSEDLELETPGGIIHRKLVTARGAGLVDFALIPHFNHPEHPDASIGNAQVWASKLPVATYAIDDQTAIQVSDGRVEVVSEGLWKLFAPG